MFRSMTPCRPLALAAGLALLAACTDALIAGAVPANRIDTSWAGESRQEITTSDNIAEQRNRVVDITVQRPL